MMTRRLPQALFFASDVATTELARLVAGIEAPLDVDVIEFAGEAGGDASREFGIPFVAGMDEVDVTEAYLAVNVSAQTDPRESPYQATQEGGGNGVFVSLSRPAALVKVALSYAAPTSPAATVRVVVRPATGTATAGFTPQPPIFAAPPYPAPGPMFAPVLGGLTLASRADGGQTLSLPPTTGSAWLIQIATGSDADGAGKLAPLNIVPTLTSVMVDAVPTNFKVTLAIEPGPVTLWSRPGSFLRGGPPQLVSFLPMAQKHLAAQLKKPDGRPTLTVPLSFHSDSASRAEVTSKKLTATYRVRPLGSPSKLRLGGGWTPLTLNAPAGLTSLAGSIDLTAKLLPRVLNSGSAEPPLQSTGAGLRVTTSRVVATAIPFAPLKGMAAGTVLPLASVRVFVEAAADSEIVMELHSDAAGAPGPVLTRPEVKQLHAGVADWLEFELTRALPVSTAGAPVWVALRLNRGEIRWYADPAQGHPARVSIDKGQTWSEAGAPLASIGGLMTQLFHELTDPLPAPTIRVQYGQQVITADLGADAQRKSPREFAAAGVILPATLRAALTSRSGAGRVDTVVHLFSRSVLDLTLDNASITYDPFGAGVTKGT